MSKEVQKAGFFRTFIKVVMIIVFFLIGAALLTAGAVYRAKGWDIGTYEGNAYNIKWLSICNIVFGACLLTSPFFFNKKRGGLNSVIKVIMIILFVAIGAALIVCGALPLAKHTVDKQYQWLPICNLAFGCCLLTSPFFFKL